MIPKFLSSKPFLKFIQSPWIIALICLCAFLSTTGYKYGWDDQHLEIPLLKTLIDNDLYQGDYYVESLKKNFSSFFYPILSKLITVEQIPQTYFVLYILSRYFLFFFIYKIWHHLTKNKFTAILCVFVFLFMLRVDEFLYRTFSHQEFTLVFIFAALYWFYKEKFWKASLLLGLAANFHGLYALFPMIFIGCYLLFSTKKHGWLIVLKVSLTFIVLSLPFSIWTLTNRMNSPTPAHLMLIMRNWPELYTYACPQNFFMPLVPFDIITSNIKYFFDALHLYLPLVSLFLVNITFNPLFKKDRKSQAICFSAFGMLLVCLIFTYIHPTRFFVDLNLTRNMQFILFIISGYTTILVINLIEREKLFIAYCVAILFTLFKYTDHITGAAASALFFLLTLNHFLKKTYTQKWKKGLFCSLSLLGAMPFIGVIIYFFNTIHFRFFTMANLAIVLSLLSGCYFAIRFSHDEQRKKQFRKALYLIPIIIFFFQYGYYNHTRLKAERSADDYWRLRKSWEDIQFYVRDNTPKDASILVPYNFQMGGFRIRSEREIVVSERDCGIIGFDFAAAIEWKKRMVALESFKMVFTSSPKKALQKAIFKYKADYIVFLRYATPSANNTVCQRVYTNMDFALFKVLPHPNFEIKR
ncbi:DUF6798 domain-containing protein [Candidatus Omnitrophota bacterium]